MAYFKKNTKLAIKLAMFVKGLTGSMVTMAFVEKNINAMFIVMLIGAFCNELINFLSNGEDDKQ